MSNKILGIDLGTNSIGLSLRNTEIVGGIKEQLEYFSSIIFPSGVGKNKTGEFSYAAERTKNRSTRKIYKVRRYRKWETLKLLIENDCCPLSMEDLQKWSKYDKSKGLKRQYPIHATHFEQWIRLDFDGDGKADYASPFELRAILMERQFDFSEMTDRYKLGRALYHIAQRRGFKSSKGETLKEQEQNEKGELQEVDITDALKKSEEKKSGKLTEYMKVHNLPTVGCAFNHLLKNGIRVRNSEYQAVRSQYKEEISCIFEFQKGLDKESDFYKRLVSEKKGEGTIFYKRPLRSQKGAVGKCTLEPNKPRCPISHPEFEKFRAWSFINNIKFGEDLSEELTLKQKKDLYKEKFLLSRKSFKFEVIREWICRRTGMTLNYKNKTINFKDSTSVSGCPISGRLKRLLGDDWECWKLESTEKKINKKTGEVRKITYDVYDLWHVCFSFDEAEYVDDFAKSKLKFDDNQAKQLVAIFNDIQQGYSQLSLKAIRNINMFLQEGLLYNDAVLLAKLPDIFGCRWEEAKEYVVSQIDSIIKENRKEKLLYSIANQLIGNYKCLSYDERFADHNFDYILDDSDYNDIKNAILNVIGEKKWSKKDTSEQSKILNDVAQLYQGFFASPKRDYYKTRKVADALAEFLSGKYDFLPKKELNKIYHPSMIEFYSPAKEQRLDDGRWLKLLGSPVIGALKNPMAMRVLHTLRKRINAMLMESMIDADDTRIVVETARELNDANMRWAIEAYQREREKENKEYEKILKEYYPGRSISDKEIDQVRLMCDQHDIPGDDNNTDMGRRKTAKNKKEVSPVYKKDVTRYRLWLEQGCRCLYTGKIINITKLFDENAFDIEHTIPRSISFDDSLKNLTICDAHYNRSVKKNQMPTQMANYKEDANGYTAILPRLQPWIEKVERLKDNVAFWKAQSKLSQDKERKDYCIRQHHLWVMELDYWKGKVERFTMTDVTSGFRNNQLNDTRIITKYAYHYLKTVFDRVSVQKGSVTANFRKILRIQSVNEKKSREKHSHHAIDATVLTLIPNAEMRDKIIKTFYSIKERERFNEDASALKKELAKELKNCQLPSNISEIVPFIEDNILVNHISKDQTLTPAHRRKRIRGKIVPKRDEHGIILYETNADGTTRKNKHGHPIPQAKEWISGDSIRGQLHKDSFFGAITQWLKDNNGEKVLDKKGNIISDTKIYYVIRRILKYKSSDTDSGFKNWEELKSVIVDKDLFMIMKNQFPENTSFKDACEHGIYMYKNNKSGILDFSDECKLTKIRHIRCFTSVKNPLAIKSQTYLSTKPYKQKYYADMGDLYAMCRYESVDKKEREYQLFSLFDISKNRKLGLEDIPTTIESKKNHRLFLIHMLKKGNMLLVYNDSEEALKEKDNKALLQHLYVVRGFENDGNRIILQKHVNAQQDKDLGKGESVKGSHQMPEKIRCGINTIKYLLCGIDFKITPKGVVFV